MKATQDKLKEKLKVKGLKVTRQRLLVLETMAERPGEHLTTEEIYDLTKENCPEIGLATIYRTIQVLLELDFIEKVNFNDGFIRYELVDEGTEESMHRHHHGICLGCGRVVSFADDLLDDLEQAVLKQAGFTVVDHEVKLYGYCTECTKHGSRTK